MWSHLSSPLLLLGMYHLVNIRVICLPSFFSLPFFLPSFHPSVFFFFLSFFSCLFRDRVCSLSPKFIRCLKKIFNPDTPTSGSWALGLWTCATSPGWCGARNYHEASCLPASHSSVTPQPSLVASCGVRWNFAYDLATALFDIYFNVVETWIHTQICNSVYSL